MYESVIAYGKNWTEITDPLYICVMSGTNLIIDLFYQPLFLVIYLLQCFTISLVQNLSHFLFLSHQYFIESLKTWFCRIAAFLAK